MELVTWGSSWSGVAGYESLDGLDSDFRPAVPVGVIGRGNSMVDTPGFEEVASGVCGEFWSSVGGEGIRYTWSVAQSHTPGFPECGYEPVSAVTRVCHDRPVGVPVDQH